MGATTNAIQFGYQQEVTWGTSIPASPVKILRITGESMKSMTESKTSDEIISSRQRTDIIRTGVHGEGGFNFELSYGNIDDFLEGVFMNTWAANILTIGTTAKHFSIEKKWADLTGANKFEIYKGCRVGSMALNVAPGSVITGSIGLTGKTGTSAAATIGTGVTAAPTNPCMNSIDDVRAFTEGGVNLFTVGATEFSLNVNNNMRSLPTIGSIDPVGINAGGVDVTGSITLYFDDTVQVAKALAWTTTDLAITMGGAASLKYLLEFAKVKITDVETVAGGVNGDAMLKMNWSAFYDATKTQMKLTRTP